MMKKITYGVFLLVCTVLAVCILWLASTSFAKAQQQMICDKGSIVLENLATRFGEVSTERGKDEGVVVIITVNPLHQWTMLVTPKEQPDLFCVLAAGHSWTQEKTSSTGISHDESVIVVSFKQDGRWSMVYISKPSKEIQSVTTTGVDWERIITLKN